MICSDGRRLGATWEGMCQDAERVPTAVRRQSYQGLVAGADEHLVGIRVFAARSSGAAVSRDGGAETGSIHPAPADSGNNETA